MLPTINVTISIKHFSFSAFDKKLYSSLSNKVSMGTFEVNLHLSAQIFLTTLPSSQTVDAVLIHVIFSSFLTGIMQPALMYKCVYSLENGSHSSQVQS
jgi:hypothetical protein